MTIKSAAFNRVFTEKQPNAYRKKRAKTGWLREPTERLSDQYGSKS
jgi:hypothetical protein